ncbi:hypothetical protein, conserved [Leishmania donovani]|uniref:RING-type domain-containing protein n=1 Tax=Leishmania donovani TaxID=5661 RepID=E9BFM6_LEIDO|nr:hypothetical protein, conserved [Leishmania donovani]TPP45390.1 hypothetical protein CGC21_32875 [Leishmania donovani]CBZ34052.1 hypothetical protein, conserved [Leishmania donovani]
MAKYFVPDTTFGMDAECAVCCCLWTDPVEISESQHIFCRGCVEGLETCPVCCGSVTRLNTPGKFILRLLQRTQGSCSACLWKGTYSDFKEKHLKCLEAGEVQSSDEDKIPTTTECVAMQEYYLEDSNTRPEGSAPSPAAVDSLLVHPAAVVNTGSPHEQRFADVTNNSASTADAHLTYEQRAQWRQSLTSTAQDYGMLDREYRELIERFPNFAVLVPDRGMAPELRWRGACRLLRFLNYPSHPDDVKNLFEMAGRDALTESVPFHVLCLWLMLNRRNPAQWYHMTAEPYEQLLKVAQLLDVEATGLFQLDQCRILAEQYFERDVCDAEWLCIERRLRSKDTEIRQSFLSSANRRRVNLDESFVLSSAKLPLHDVLCAFTRHVDALRKEQQQQSEAQRMQADYVRRIKRIVGFYEPSAVSQLDVTLQKFTGEEESLLMTLTAMYGPEPP